MPYFQMRGFGQAESTGLATLQDTCVQYPTICWIHKLASIAGVATGAYHGYKRNRGSVGWAIGWALLGGMVPYVTIPVSLAQGFGKPA